MGENKRIELNKVKELTYGISTSQLEIVENAKRYLEKKAETVSNYPTGLNVINIIKNSKYFKTYVNIIEELDETVIYDKSIKHGITHNYRTSVLAAYLGIKDKLDEADFSILILASLYHDIGKKDDSFDPSHGMRSAKKLRSLKLNLSDADKILLRAVITAHSVESSKMSEVLDMYGIKSKLRAKRLIRILKDADTLDKVRLTTGIDSRYISSKEAKKLIRAAYDIYANINAFDIYEKDGWTNINSYIKLINSDENKVKTYNELKIISELSEKGKIDCLNKKIMGVKKAFYSLVLDKRYVRVIFKDDYKADGKTVIEADLWNPRKKKPEEMGGINYSTYDKLLRWLVRGDTICDINLLPDSQVIECDSISAPHGVFRTDKLILSNPVKITDKMAMDIYLKSNLPEKSYYKALAGLAIRGYEDTAKKLIKDRVNRENIHEVLSEVNDFIKPDETNHKGNTKVYNEILKTLKNIESKNK